MNNNVRACIQTNDVNSSVVGFENFLHSENLFKMASKRKRIFVSMEKQLDALKRIERGESLKSITSSFGVGESTVK